MSKLKSITLLTAMLGMVMAENPQRYIEPKETPEQRKKRLQLAEIKSNQAKGLKEFYYGEVSIWARDRKNADRKARNKGLI